MKYFIIAGEASGDLHGANLVRSLMKCDGNAEIVCRGGDLMAEAGATLLTHYRATAFMGFWEVLVNLRKVFAGMRECRSQILAFKPDVLILIDYPGFNLKMAAFAREHGIPVYYYISPKIWAWKESRINAIKRDVSRMYSILPFEIEFYAKHGFRVEYFGNPLVDEIERRRSMLSDRGSVYETLGLDDRPVIGLLAGSRVQEVKRILPAMLAVTGYYHDYQFVLAASENIDPELLRTIIGSRPVKVVYGNTYEILAVSEVALVKSGTSTLEAALIGTPQVVCYRAGRISYILARMLVKVRFISLVNLLLDKEVVRELIQGDLNEMNIVKELNTLIKGGWKRNVIRKHYAEIRSMLGEPGVSDRVAADICKSLKSLKG
ncbi:MAG: lipid-A-disaccharide synthase [Bacteroidales bacterium]